ncbi:MAG TPA: helicase HerA-like domain-containing protein [Solirubrobacteraceae bacterium]
MPLNTPYPHSPADSELQPPGGVHPLAPLEALAQGLFSAAIHVAVGYGLGLLAARAMRRHHLHWSWAVGALVLVVMARGVFAGAAPTAVGAALTAVAHGRRWHREDLHAGADLAETARRRTRPSDTLRIGVRRLCQRLSERPARSRPMVREDPLAHSSAGRTSSRDACDRARVATARGERWFRAGRLTVGEDERGRAVSIPLGGAGGGTHTLVLGATGSGKTVTQTWLAVRAVERGMAVVVVDPKGDRGLRLELLQAARGGGRRFVEWTPDGPSVYNPFARGAAGEIADKLLAGERFSEPHYQRQAQRYLGHAVRTLRAAGTEVSLARIVEHLDPDCLELLARSLPAERACEVHAYLDSLTPRQRTDLSGVRDRLAILAESDVGTWLDPRTPGARRFDLLGAIGTRAVVYCALRADSRPLLAQMLGAAIVQDLQTAMAALQARPVPSLVVIDEFSAVAAQQVVHLFERGRSAGMSLVLGTQELSSLRVPGSPALLEQVLGNVSALIAHRQAVPDSADLVSRLSGTRGAWGTSLGSDGRSTRRRIHEPLLEAAQIGALNRGCAAVLTLGDAECARLTRMYAPSGGV